MKKLVVITSVTLLLLAGCITPPRIAQNNFAFQTRSKPLEGSGVIVGTIVRDIDQKWESYELNIRRIDGEKSSYAVLNLGAGGMFSKNEVDLAGTPGATFAKELPAGEYEIYRHSAYVGGVWRSTNHPYSVRFTVPEGEIIYLGRIRVQHVFGKNMFGITIPSIFTWEVVDNFKEDLELLAYVYEQLETERVTKSVIHGEYSLPEQKIQQGDGSDVDR